jgi:hypothetical protein
VKNPHKPNPHRATKQGNVATAEKGRRGKKKVGKGQNEKKLRGKERQGRGREEAPGLGHQINN